MEMNLPVTVQKSFPNDKARIIFSTMSEAKDLATAQSEVNKTMAEAQQSVKDFSSIAKIRNGGYYTQPIYTNPKKGEAPVLQDGEPVKTSSLDRRRQRRCLIGPGRAAGKTST